MREGTSISRRVRGVSAVVQWAVLFGVFTACAGRNRGAPPQLAVPTMDAGGDGAVSTGADAGGVDGLSPLVRKVAVPLPCGPTAFSAAVQGAMAPLRTFSKASPDDATAAGQVLMALADAIDSLPGSAAAKVQKDVEEIRFEAKRLQRSDHFSFGNSRWIKLGLAAAGDALARMTSSGERWHYWVEAGRQAGDPIDPNASLVFQRAVLQDSMRVLVDAFIVVGQCSGVCP